MEALARAVAFFASEAAGRRGAVRALYDELAAEEREHVDLLVTELDRWRAGRAGLLTSG